MNSSHMGSSRETAAGRAVKIVWATCLCVLCIHLASGAVGPLLGPWGVSDFDREGQLTVLNAKRDGGVIGHPLEIGDYDGDGFFDLVMAPMFAAAGPIEDPPSQRPGAGEVYVYRGDGALGKVLDRDSFGASAPGLTLWGERAGDLLGTELFTHDLDGDGIEDLIIGSQNQDGPGAAPSCDRENCGAVYVVFGEPGLLDESRTIDLAAPAAPDGPRILRVYGAHKNGRLGIWVEAGDLDGDGFGDLIAGADQGPTVDTSDPLALRGKVVVIYGREEFPEVIDLATESDTFPGMTTVLGRDANDHLGASLHSADLDGDGRDELIAAAALNRLSAGEPGPSCDPEERRPFSFASAGGDGPENDRLDAGEIWVFFGPEEGGRLPREIDLAAPLPGDLAARTTVIHGAAFRDFCGEEIASGDFNGDGLTDLALGALTADAPDGTADAGMTHVIYWQSGLEGTVIDLAPAAAETLPEGLRVSTLHGVESSDILGDTLSVADFNNDGIDDLAVAAPHATDDPDRRQIGIVTIVFGRAEAWPALWAPQSAAIPAGIEVAHVTGSDEFDLLSYSMEARDYDRDGYADLFPNAMRGDGAGDAFANAGEAYVVSGYALRGTELSISGVVPAHGSTGTIHEVWIAGTGFTTTEDTTVRADDVPLEDAVVESGTAIRAVLPASDASRSVELTVETRYGSVALPGAFVYVARGEFARSDTTGDAVFDITDPIRTLTVLFLDSALGFACADAADADDDGEVTINDAIYTLNHLFLGGPPPPAPYPDIGPDPTDDALPCSE